MSARRAYGPGGSRLSSPSATWPAPSLRIAVGEPPPAAPSWPDETSEIRGVVETGSARFRILDGWRGVAALCVALYRFEADGALFNTGVVRHAGLFVDFFFVLSGFVIAHAYFDRLKDGRSLTNFVIRRFGRLWPLHAAMFVPFFVFEAARLWIGLKGGQGDALAPFTGYRAPGTIPIELTFLNSIGLYHATGWNTPSWSISSEFWTYILFGALCIPGRRAMPVIAAALVLGALALAFKFGPGDFDMIFGLGTLRCVAGFFAGVGVNLLWRASRSRTAAYRPALGMAEIPMVLFAFGFVALAGGNLWSFGAPIVFGALVFVFAAEAGPASRAMDTKVFRLLGDLSYSIYMTALLIALVFGRGIVAVAGRFGADIAYETKAVGETFEVFGFATPGVNDLLALVYLGLVVAVSYVTWRFIERPGRRWFNALADRTSGVSASE